MPNFMKHVYLLAIIVFGIMIGKPLAQLTEPGVDRIVNSLNSLSTLPGQSTVGMKGSLIQCRGQNVVPTPVTNAQNTNSACDLWGRQIIANWANPENMVSGDITAAMTATTSTTLLAAPAAGLRNYVTQLTCDNTHATVSTEINVTDGTSPGTIIYHVPAAAVYGGAAITFPVPLRQPTTANTLNVVNVTTGASTRCAAVGFTGA